MKQVPGHHVQVDVRFLDFKVEGGKKIRCFQYTAIDDATRIRALKIYERHAQQNAIDFVDYVIAKFHWHLEDMGVRHVYIKPRAPRLNGKVERSHGADQREFYQLLMYTDDAGLYAKTRIVAQTGKFFDC